MLVFASCVDNDSPTIPVNPGNAKIRVQLLESASETISTIDVLAFKVDELDNTKEYFAYRSEGTNIVDGDAPNKKEFSVSLLSGGQSAYRFVVLTNARQELDALGDIATSGLKTEVLNRLVVENQGKWVHDPQNPTYRDTPMWAESTQLKIDANTQLISGLYLIRMLARVDVSVNTDIQSKFKLKSVRVYNTNTQAYIVPLTDAEHWNGTAAIKPSIPLSNQKVVGPLVYSELSSPDIGSQNQIFVFEAAAGVASQPAQATCLVVGGDFENSGIETFYRVDFSNKVGEVSTYYHLLRNHFYDMKVSLVKGLGYSTPDEAFNAQPSNMNVDIIVWSNAGLSDVVIDGQYTLSISKSEFTLTKDAQTVASTNNKLTVKATHPDGWKIDKIVDLDGNAISWLTTSINTGLQNNETTLSLLLQENTTNIIRTGNIHIKSGRIDYVVKVTQTITPDVHLNVTDTQDNAISELLFSSHVDGVVPPQNFVVKWIPKAQSVSLNVTGVAQLPAFNFSGGGMLLANGTISNADGLFPYTIQPPAFTKAEVAANPFLEKASTASFTLSYAGEIAAKNLIVRQVNYAAIPTISQLYVMDGTQKSFLIKSNAPWKVEVTNDPKNVIQQLVTTTGGQAMDKLDHEVFFKIVNDQINHSILNSDVTLTIKSTDPRYPFADIPVILKCISRVPWFLVHCESTLVNGIYQKDKALDGTNTITLDVTVLEIGTYTISTNVVDGISFVGSGEFSSVGTQQVTLHGVGIPSTNLTKTVSFTTNSSDTSDSGCSAVIRMLIPQKTILSLGTNGWAIHGTSGVANMFNNAANFGSLNNSLYKTVKPDVKPAGQYLVTLTNTVLQPYLEPTVGKPVDIVVMTYSANLSGAAASTMLANYVKKGGVLIMLNEQVQAIAANLDFIKALFNDNSLVVVNDAVVAGVVMQLPSNDDEILNGPFGDIRGKYIGEDGGFSDVFSVLPASHIDWKVTSVDFSGTGGSASQIYAFKAKNYNFFWCGDGGMASTNGSTSFTSYPVTLTASPNYVPSNRLYGRNAANRHLADNGIFFANMIAWAIQQAEFNGINTVK